MFLLNKYMVMIQVWPVHYVEFLWKKLWFSFEIFRFALTEINNFWILQNMSFSSKTNDHFYSIFKTFLIHEILRIWISSDQVGMKYMEARQNLLNRKDNDEFLQVIANVIFFCFDKLPVEPEQRSALLIYMRLLVHLCEI